MKIILLRLVVFVVALISASGSSAAPRIAFLTFALLLAAVNPSQALDADGKYVAFGNESCGAYISARKKDQDLKYAWWLLGYMTAANYHSVEVNNYLGDSDIKSALLWIEKYCENNPLSNTAVAAEHLIIALYPTRHTRAPAESKTPAKKPPPAPARKP